jgi:hypothetical protein
MITFNAESIRQVETSSVGLFEDIKLIFVSLGKIVEGCGDNPAAAVLEELGAEAEKIINDTVLPNFMTLRDGVGKYVSNHEEWEAKCGRMERINMSAVQAAEVENKLKPVTFK